MSEEPSPDPRRALIESNLARTRDKLTAANARVAQLETQVEGLEAELAALDAPADPPAEE